MDHLSEIISASRKVRTTIWEMVYRARASHVASAFSCVDLISYLYFSKLYNFSPEVVISERDSVILSKGHACTAIYATLYHCGIISDADILSYGQNGSSLMHHISHKVPGVDFSTGSLGHGLSVSLGLALSDKLEGNQNKRFCILGDGELMEGSNWEAILLASHLQLNNLVVFIDFNNLQSLTTVDQTVGIEPIEQKFLSFDWYSQQLDGHNYLEISNALNHLHPKKPNVIIANTIKGKGISFIENSVKWHYKNPSEDEYNNGLKELSSA